MVDYKAVDEEMLKVQGLMKHAGKFKVLSKERERELILGAQSDDPTLKRESQKILLNHNFRLIIKIAKKYAGQGIEFEDLIQEGSDGFLHAVSKFDLSTDYKLSTYAVMWIHQKMGRSIANKSRLVKIPTNKLAEVTKLKKVYMEYVVEENRPPTSVELAKKLDWPVDKAEQLGRMVYTHASLDQSSGEEEIPLLNYVVDEKTLPEDKLENHLDREYILSLVNQLEPDEQFFIKYKYGFLDDKFRKDKEMSTYFKITAKEVKLREEEILKKLKSISDITKVNADILCSVELLSYGEYVEQVRNELKLRGIKTYIGCPFIIADQVSQHTAYEIKHDLEILGAVVRVLPITRREG